MSASIENRKILEPISTIIFLVYLISYMVHGHPGVDFNKNNRVIGDAAQIVLSISEGNLGMKWMNGIGWNLNLAIRVHSDSAVSLIYFVIETLFYFSLLQH